MKNIIHAFILLILLLVAFSSCAVIERGVARAVRDSLDSSKYKVSVVTDSAMVGVEKHMRAFGDSASTGAVEAFNRNLQGAFGDNLSNQVNLIVKKAFKQTNEEAEILIKKLGQEGANSAMTIRDSIFNEKLKVQLVGLREAFFSPELGNRFQDIIRTSMKGLPEDVLQKMLHNALFELRQDTSIAYIRNELLGAATQVLLDTLIIRSMKTLNEGYQVGLGRSVDTNITGIRRFIADNLYIVAGIIGLIFLFIAWLLNWYLKQKHKQQLTQVKTHNAQVVSKIKTENAIMMSQMQTDNSIMASSNNIQDVLEVLVRKIIQENQQSK